MVSVACYLGYFESSQGVLAFKIVSRKSVGASTLKIVHTLPWNCQAELHARPKQSKNTLDIYHATMNQRVSRPEVMQEPCHQP